MNDLQNECEFYGSDVNMGVSRIIKFLRNLALLSSNAAHSIFFVALKPGESLND